MTVSRGGTTVFSVRKGAVNLDVKKLIFKL